MWLRLLVLLAISWSGTAGAQRVSFCCQGASGYQVCSDTLPAECYGRPYREISPQGIVRRQVDAPSNLDQRLAEQRRRREQERSAREQSRRDSMLVDVYASERDLDIARERAERILEQDLTNLKSRLQDASRRRDEQRGQLAAATQPAQQAELRRNLKRREEEIEALRQAVGEKQAELESTRQRFDDDKRRYRELTRIRQQRYGADSGY